MNSDIQSIIASVGFPIALSMYLLVRIEGKLQTLTDSINELSKNIIIKIFWIQKKFTLLNRITALRIIRT